MGTDNGALARRYLTELWGKGKLELIEELVDDDIALIDPMTPEPAKGVEALKQRIDGMGKTFTEGETVIDEVVVAGDTVTVRTRWMGVHSGDFFGLAPTSRRVTCPAAEIIKIRNGKVVENTSYFDLYSMFQQLGALPAPDQLKAQREAQQPSQTATA